MLIFLTEWMLHLYAARYIVQAYTGQAEQYDYMSDPTVKRYFEALDTEPEQD